MTIDSTTQTVPPVTLGEALDEYLNSLKPGDRPAQRALLDRYVRDVGASLNPAALNGSRVEEWAETTIKPNDPAARERVAILKHWFVYLKKKNYTAENLGSHVRLRRVPGRGSLASRTRIEQSPIEMTPDGLRKVQQELEDLRNLTPELVKAIALAREDKDFRENAPLDAAREALGYNEGRIRELEYALRRAVAVQGGAGDDRSSLGSTVRVTRVDNDTIHTYTLVSAREADAREQRISVDSPVGRQLLGRREGDEVIIEAPSGVIQMRIDSVSRS